MLQWRDQPAPALHPSQPAHARSEFCSGVPVTAHRRAALSERAALAICGQTEGGARVSEDQRGRCVQQPRGGSPECRGAGRTAVLGFLTVCASSSTTRSQRARHSPLRALASAASV